MLFKQYTIFIFNERLLIMNKNRQHDLAQRLLRRQDVVGNLLILLRADCFQAVEDARYIIGKHLGGTEDNSRAGMYQQEPQSLERKAESGPSLLVERPAGEVITGTMPDEQRGD